MVEIQRVLTLQVIALEANSNRNFLYLVVKPVTQLNIPTPTISYTLKRSKIKNVLITNAKINGNIIKMVELHESDVSRAPCFSNLIVPF